MGYLVVVFVDINTACHLNQGRIGLFWNHGEAVRMEAFEYRNRILRRETQQSGLPEPVAGKERRRLISKAWVLSADDAPAAMALGERALAQQEAATRQKKLIHTPGPPIGTEAHGCT